MKLIFASDSFKGSLTSLQTAGLLTKAAHEVFGICECICVPVADGGEGTADAVIAALNGRIVRAESHDPLMNRIGAAYGIAGDTAVIETAQASGLTLVPAALRDPMHTTTYGTGELILDALDQGCRRLCIAVGGSATNDGGMGCMRALGMRFLDQNGNELSGCGKDLAHVAAIDAGGLDRRLSDIAFTVLCDVKNPLCGATGATYTFAAQKGASRETIERLESGMQNYRDVIRRRFGADCDTPGCGAAGGLGAALKVFLNAEMQSGIETVLELIGFDGMLEGADLVVTGEGRADSQSCCGKVMQGVGLHAKAKGIPVIGLCGSLGEGAEELLQYGVTELVSVSDQNVSIEEATKNAEAFYYNAAVRLFRRLKNK